MKKMIATLTVVLALIVALTGYQVYQASVTEAAIKDQEQEVIFGSYLNHTLRVNRKVDTRSDEWVDQGVDEDWMAKQVKINLDPDVIQ